MKKTVSTYVRLTLLVLMLAIGVLMLASCGAGSGSPDPYGAPIPTQPTTTPPIDPGY